ncbi:SDR family NAD(P)-dependent oxidoreductase, partial [Streptomyces sp. NPDC088251]|uniref:SDR family NAD(P)-dependent oxidoreductase n=1 Tax=unclassified Streptomyces TaxID=2593676 RepID=UPI0037FB8821
RPDWNAYYSNENRHRIPLPTHPLNRKHHWLDRRPATVQSEMPSGNGARRRDALADWYYSPSWQRTSLPVGAIPETGLHWLVFADRLGVGKAVAERLRDAGAVVTVVEEADAWEKTAPGRYAINAARGSDYARLLGDLRDSPVGLPTRLVHAWSVTAMHESELRDEEASLRGGFGSLVHLAQALAQHPHAESPRMWVLSNGLHNITGNERLSPLKATLLGPSRVLPREMAGLGCRSVDLDCLGAPTSAQLDRLMSELAHEPEPDPATGTATVAHRGIHRWSQHYLTQALPPHAGRPVLREEGVYLVTGGTGGLGLALVEHLAKSGGRVALTARTALPPDAEWDEWLARQRGDESSGAIDTVRRLRRMRDAGAQVLVLQADVSDRAAMREAVRTTVEHWGAIHGVFHTAGVPGGGLIQLKDMKSAVDVMLPKVRGTLVLEEELREQELDFLVLFSSNGANIGSVGQMDYCAANCFLDAFAQDRGRRQRVISIDWGPWKDVGMTVNTVLPAGMEQPRRDRVAQLGMTVDEGLRALDTILAGAPEPQIIVSPADLGELFAQAFSLGGEASAASPKDAEGPADQNGVGLAHDRPDLRTRYEAPRSHAERTICAVWQNLLGVELIGVQDSFFDLGGNSLVAIQLVSTVNRRLDAGITVGDLYEGGTVAHLAALVEGAETPAPRDSADALKSAEGRRENMQKRRQHQQRRRMARGQQ